jgi:hypothetical protein
MEPIEKAFRRKKVDSCIEIRALKMGEGFEKREEDLVWKEEEWVVGIASEVAGKIGVVVVVEVEVEVGVACLGMEFEMAIFGSACLIELLK